MEEFNLLGHHNPKPSLSQMDLFNNLEGFNLPLSSQGFSHDHQLPLSFHDEIPRSVGPIFDPMVHFFPSGNSMNLVHEPEIQVSSSPPSDSGTTAGFLGPGKVNYKKQQVQNYGGKKRKRISERAIEKPREVVHVRAKRGQATDSHSLAERLRREKINEKLRCLQDLVPGCYKTMGMAVMLDVIINYVRSLQNQIDFLSMKLSAASLFYDFNSSEAEAMETLQGTNGYETAQGMEKLVGEAYEGTSHFQTVPWPL